MKKIMILGGDGYLGWSLALAIASRIDSQVILVDHYGKRRWQDECGVKALFEIPFLSQRIHAYEKKTGNHNLSAYSLDVTCYQSIHNLIERYSPDVIINAAQQPSAPYSMISPDHARYTSDNNYGSCLNVLWAVSVLCPDTLIINVGSAGVYLSTDADYIPKKKVNLHYESNGKQHAVLKSWLPMQASDFYHQSKANTFGLTDLCTKLWKLRVITVMQSIIFGNTIPENKNYLELATRFNYDHIFGTVLNRFICQAVINYPMTIYGDGHFSTGLSCLSCAVDSYIQLIDAQILPGEHQVEHNHTHRLSINHIAQRISDLSGVELQYIDNPREGEVICDQEKTFEPSNLITEKDIQFCDNEILEMLNFVKYFKDHIHINHILPQVKWSV